jgi:hypothetical protein
MGASLKLNSSRDFLGMVTSRLKVSFIKTVSSLLRVLYPKPISNSGAFFWT